MALKRDIFHGTNTVCIHGDAALLFLIQQCAIHEAVWFVAAAANHLNCPRQGEQLNQNE